MTTYGTTSGATSASSPGIRLGRVALISVAAAFGGLLFGYDTAVINGAVDALQEHFRAGSAITGFTVSAALVGSAVGAWFAGSIADRLGRTRAMRIAAALFAVSALGSTVPFSVWDLAAWRTIGGLAVGIASVVAPAYIAEVAPAAYRGRLTSVQQLAIVLGIAVSQVVNYGIAEAADGSASNALGPLAAWQWMLGAAFVPAMVYLLVTFVIPESPRHLVRTGRTEQAGAVLRAIEPRVDVADRVAEIQRVLGAEPRSRPRDLRGRRTGLLPIVWVGILLAAFQQFVGINVIFYYSSSLWHSVGMEEDSSLLLSLFTSLVNIAGTLISIALVDRIGRKTLLIIGSTGMTVSLAVTGWAFSFARQVGDDAQLPYQWGVVALISASCFVLFFAASWGAVMWVLLSEMFPMRIRAAAICVSTAANWAANWLVSVSFPAMRDWSLSGTYFIYALCALVSLYFAARHIREWKGRTLEEVALAETPPAAAAPPSAAPAAQAGP